jgi:hypothetical protein
VSFEKTYFGNEQSNCGKEKKKLQKNEIRTDAPFFLSHGKRPTLVPD